MKKLIFESNGERFYDITQRIRDEIKKLCSEHKRSSGIATLFCPHTSCAIAITEAYEDSARIDIENFFKHIAPRNLNFISHRTEGPDDSPSHMKSILLNASLNLILDHGEVILGRWQGIYLTEFRDDPKQRELWIQVIFNETP